MSTSETPAPESVLHTGLWATKAELVAALTNEWQRLSDLPGDPNSGTRFNQYESLVAEGIAERRQGSGQFFRLAPAQEPAPGSPEAPSPCGKSWGPRHCELPADHIGDHYSSDGRTSWPSYREEPEAVAQAAEIRTQALAVRGAVMTIALYGERRGDHVHCRVFMGEDGKRASVGTLVMRIGEWQIFGAALRVAASTLGPDHLTVFCDDPLSDKCTDLCERNHRPGEEEGVR